MEEKSLDLMLTADHVSEYRFFIYTLPDGFIGYKDPVSLYIFFDERQFDTMPDYYAEVWARVSYDPKVIWQIDSLCVSAKDYDERGFQAILDELNRSEDFLPNLRKLIGMVERAKQGAQAVGEQQVSDQDGDGKA